MFCPLWVGETDLSGLRMVRCSAILHVRNARRLTLVCFGRGAAQDYCASMPSFDSQATLPQYFLIQARMSVACSLVKPYQLAVVTQQKHPNYAPDAAPPLLSVPDWVVYESRMNPALCRGTSLVENCMIDSFHIPVHV